MLIFYIAIYAARISVTHNIKWRTALRYTIYLSLFFIAYTPDRLAEPFLKLYSSVIFRTALAFDIKRKAAAPVVIDRKHRLLTIAAHIHPIDKIGSASDRFLEFVPIARKLQSAVISALAANRMKI